MSRISTSEITYFENPELANYVCNKIAKMTFDTVDRDFDELQRYASAFDKDWAWKATEIALKMFGVSSNTTVHQNITVQKSPQLAKYLIFGDVILDNYARQKLKMITKGQWEQWDELTEVLEILEKDWVFKLSELAFLMFDNPFILPTMNRETTQL